MRHNASLGDCLFFKSQLRHTSQQTHLVGLYFTVPGEINSGMLCSGRALHFSSSLYIVGILVKLMSHVIHAVYLRHTFFSMQKLYNYQFKVKRKASKEAIFGRTRIVFFFWGGGAFRVMWLDILMSGVLHFKRSSKGEELYSSCEA
jgi:hypothetical protein